MSSTNGFSPSACSSPPLARDRSPDAVLRCRGRCGPQRRVAAQAELFAEVRMPARLRARQAPAVLARLAGRLNRVDDPPVARAAAQMAVERLRDRVAVVGLPVLNQRRRADDDAGDAEAALHAALEHERFARGCAASPREGPRASRRRGRAICSGLRRHDSAGRPSTMTRQQPQAPSGAQPSLADTTPHSSRSTSRKCIPGSYEASTAFPFRVNAILGIRLPSMVSFPCFGPSVQALQACRIARPEGRRYASNAGGHMQEPWKTDKWFTSPWCYLPEVREERHVRRRTSRSTTSRCATASSRRPWSSAARRRSRSRRSSTRSASTASRPACRPCPPQDKAAISDIAALGLKAEIFALLALHSRGDQGRQGSAAARASSSRSPPATT